MTVQSIMDAHREKIEGCEVVAYGDYKSRVIFRSSQDPHIRREVLDALCRGAETAFAQLDFVSARCGRETGEPLLACATSDGQRVIAFARKKDGRGEFLCLSGTLTASMADALNIVLKALCDVEAAL